MINRKDIHESAYIDNNVSIGKNTKIWHFLISVKMLK